MTTLTIHRHTSTSAPGASSDGWRPLEFASGCIAAGMVAASAAGLWWHALYRDNTWSKAAFRGGDLASLALAVPTLVVATILARRGSSVARLAWAGVLAYNVYNFAFYLFGTAFNKLFLLYAALVAASALTLGYAAPRLARERAFREGAKVRLVSGYLFAVAMMFAVLWTVQSLAFVVNDKLPKTITDSGIHTNIVFALDLTLMVPAFVLGAVYLWQRRPAGLVLGVVLNVFAVLYMASLAAAGGFQANAGISNVSWSAPPYLELGVLSLVAIALVRKNTRPAVVAGVAGTARGEPEPWRKAG